MKASYAFPTTTLSEHARDFIKSILVLDPSKRPTLKQMLEHPFIKIHSTPLLAPPPSEGDNDYKKSLIMSANNNIFGSTIDKACKICFNCIIYSSHR